MGFSRQEYWNGLPCPPPEDLVVMPSSRTPFPSQDRACILRSPALAGRFSTTSTTWEAPLRPRSVLNYPSLESQMEKAMAPHSSTLAWKIPRTEEPGRLQSMGSLRVGQQLSNFTFTFHFPALEKEMATHSSVLAWRIPGMGEPGGLPSMGSLSIGQG